MASYRIRPLRGDDPHELHTVAAFSMMTILETLPEARRDPSIVPGLGIEAMAAQYARGQRNRDHRYWVVVDEDDDIVAHAIALMRVDDEGRPEGYSYTRYVLPAHRRQGLAAQLLDEALAWWRQRGAHHVEAHTHPSNEATLALFASRGFEVLDQGAHRWPAVRLRLTL